MKFLRYIPAAIAFIAIACYFLIGCYSDMLFTAQDRSAFVASSIFFAECMTRPFGLMQYLGAYLTQFFYIPALGAALLIGIWTATYAAGVKAFNVSSRWAPFMVLPVACLLASIVDIGYWIYCFQIPGYWFSQSLAYLIMLLLLWAFRCTPSKWQSVWYIIAALIFPLLGWTATLMVVCMLIMQIVDRIADKRGSIFNRESLFTAVGGFIAMTAPKLIWCNVLYKNFYEPIVWYGGFPWFESSTVSSLRPVTPFFMLIGLTLLYALFANINIAWDKSKVITKLHINHIVVAIPLAIAAFYIVDKQKFEDYNYLAEMRMTQAAMNNDWQAVIAEQRASTEICVPSRTMVMLKNIALMNTEGLGEYSFAIDNNSGNEIYNPDSLNLNTMLIASPLMYYNYGCMNYAIRWCMENAIGYGFSPFYLKSLAQCAAATGEKELEARYTSRLNKTQFYSNWKAQQPSQTIKKLAAMQKDVIDHDGNNCERYLIETLGNIRGTGDPKIQEMALFYAILARDASKFMGALTEFLATHPGKPLPRHFQEAYVMFRDLKQMSLPVEIPASVIQNYREFWEEGQRHADTGLDKNGVASMMLSNWNGYYWWFNAFGREVY